MWANSTEKSESSEIIQQRVFACHQRQMLRQEKANAQLSSAELRVVCQLNADDNEFLELAIEKLNLSTRAHHKILKIARTLADMEALENIERKHLTKPCLIGQWTEYYGI